MSFTSSETKNLITKKRDDGIYELMLLAETREAVDEWIDAVAAIWEDHHHSRQPIPILTTSVRPLNLPLNYAFKKGLELTRRYRKLPKGRTAFVVDDSIMKSMVNTFLKLLPISTEIRYYTSQEQEQAIVWLKELITTTTTTEEIHG